MCIIKQRSLPTESGNVRVPILGRVQAAGGVRLHRQGLTAGKAGRTTGHWTQPRADTSGRDSTERDASGRGASEREGSDPASRLVGQRGRGRGGKELKEVSHRVVPLCNQEGRETADLRGRDYFAEGRRVAIIWT